MSWILAHRRTPEEERSAAASGLAVDELAEPDNILDDVDEPVAEPDDDVDEDPPRKVLPAKKCKTPSCARLFQPTHYAQKFCPRCRGFRVTEPTTGPPSESWWTKATSRDDFHKRASEREETMRTSKESRQVGLKILGER